jgi:protease I
MTDLTGKKIAFAVAKEGIEQIELTSPWEAVQDAGGQPVLVSVEKGEVQAFNHLDKGDTFDVDDTFADADPDAYDGLVLPGGVANPDALRTDEDAVAFVKAFFDADKPVAAICHAPWTLVEADVVRDRHLTSWPSLRTDLVNAGARWEDNEVIVDTDGPNVLVTSRKPGDLPAFDREMIGVFAARLPG